MTVSAAEKRYRRELIATHIPELDEPWYARLIYDMLAWGYVVFLLGGLFWLTRCRA